MVIVEGLQLLVKVKVEVVVMEVVHSVSFYLGIVRHACIQGYIMMSK